MFVLRSLVRSAGSRRSVAARLLGVSEEMVHGWFEGKPASEDVVKLARLLLRIESEGVDLVRLADRDVPDLAALRGLAARGGTPILVDDGGERVVA